MAAGASSSTADRSPIPPLPGADPRQLLLVATAMDNFNEASNLIYAVLENDATTIAKERNELEVAGEGVEMVLNEMLNPENCLDNLLHLAAGMGDNMTCAYIFNHLKPNVNAELFGATPLHFALDSVNPDDTVKLLLDNHADPIKPDGTGRTPLVIASSKGLDKCVDYLINRGADPNEIPQLTELPVTEDDTSAANSNDNEPIFMQQDNLQNINSSGEPRFTQPQDNRHSSSRSGTPGIPRAQGGGSSNGDQNSPADTADAKEEKEKKLTELPVTEDDTSAASSNDNEPIFMQQDNLQNINSSGEPRFMQPQDNQHSSSRSGTPGIPRAQGGGSSNGDRNSPADTADAKKEKEKKGMVAFLFGNMDKLPSMFLSVALIAIAASHVSKSDGKHIVELSESMFQIMCVGTILSIHTNILCFAFAALFKETEEISNVGFKLLSFVVLVQNLIFIALVCLVLIGLERAKPLYVCLAAAVLVIAFIVVWPFLKDPPKSVIDWIKSQIDKRRARNREERRLPVTDI